MENSPLDPVETLETRYAAAKRDLAQESATVPAAAGHERRHDIRQTSRTIGPHACRSIGKAQDGTSDDDDAPGNDAAVDRFVGGVSGGRRHRAVLSCGGTLRTPRYGRDVLARAIRWNGGVPVAHDIAARRAFYPGRGRPPWNRANRRRGRRERKPRDSRGTATVLMCAWLALCAATSMTGTVTCRSRGRKPERERSPARDSAVAQNPCIVAVGSTTRCTTP